MSGDVVQLLTHRPWCSHHLDSPCPVSNEPYEACQTVMYVVPAAVRSSGISLIVYQEPTMPAPLVRVETDLSEMTVEEAREFNRMLSNLLDRIGADR